MDIFELEIDEEKAEQGVWKAIGEGNIEICYRSPTSQTFIDTQKRLERPFLQQIRKKTLTPEKQLELLHESIIQGGIIDWRNIEYKGKPLPFTTEKCRQLIRGGKNQPQYTRIGNAIINGFLEVDSFLHQIESDGEKNLQSSSNGNITGEIRKIV